MSDTQAPQPYCSQAKRNVEPGDSAQKIPLPLWLGKVPRYVYGS